MIHTPRDTLADLQIAGLWPQSRSMLSSRANGTQFRVVSMRRRTTRRSLAGGWISTRFVILLSCVPSIPLDNCLPSASSSQTEFANGTDTGVTEIRRGITNAHSTVRDAHTDIPNSSIAIPEVRCDVSQTIVPGPCSSAIDSHPIAFGVQVHDRADVHTVDPSIHREGRKNTCTDSQHQAVSTSRTVFTDLDSYNRLALRQVRN